MAKNEAQKKGSQPTIEVKGITKVYRMYDSDRDRFRESMSLTHKQYGRDHYALNDISFSLNEGEILGIIGVNGSGKSTLLKIITGVLQPTSGTVKVNGRISSLLELGAGFNPEYTGVENIYFNGMVMGYSHDEMAKRVDDIIAFADIGDFINQPVRTYSSGMYVRLAYAVAVCIEPDILIVDEALAVGDAYFQMKSLTRMQELFKKGKNVIFVSHDTASIKAMCTKCLLLDHGKAVAYGECKDIVEMYESQVRAEMSATQTLVKEPVATVTRQVEDLTVAGTVPTARCDAAFRHRVEYSREGSGEARVRCVQLIDAQGREVQDTEFGKEYIIRMHIEFLKDCSIIVGYHIRDEKNVPILGSNCMMEEHYELEGQAGDWVVADFRTSLPLRDGRYNIMTVLSHELISGQTAAFVDVTKDGLYFQMAMNKPYRVWNTVQLPNAFFAKKAIAPGGAGKEQA